MTPATLDQRGTVVSRLQAQAWAVANASYKVPNGEAYRAYAQELYELDVYERIDRVLARLDQQNALLDAVLVRARSQGDGADHDRER
jgi:hypothetical protein